MPDTPAAVKAPASKRVIIDSIVLAFSKSDVREVVGTDALKMVLDGHYKEMAQTPGVLLLQPVYDLLIKQPGFVAENATPAFCRIKLWETRLNIAIELPKELGALGVIERDRSAIKCKVSDEDLARILNPGATATAKRAPSAASAPVASTAAGAESVPATVARRLLAYVLLALGILGAGVSVWWTFGSNQTRSLTPNEISTEIPLKAAKRSGETVGAVLSDKTAWLSRPLAERKRLLQEAFEKSHAMGAQRFLLMDEQGHVFGHAQVGEDGKPATVVQ